MKRKIAYIALVLLALLLLVQVPGWVDAYFRDVVNEAISKQVDERRDEIDAQMQENINQALHNEEVQDQVQVLLRRAVAEELEENGESHLRRVIERRAPHAIPLLFPEKTADKSKKTADKAKNTQ